MFYHKISITVFVILNKYKQERTQYSQFHKPGEQKPVNIKSYLIST